MKQLETSFTLDNAVFTQVKRNDKAALYRRETPEGAFVQFEVFAIRTKDGAEVYPNQTAVSKWLYCPIAEDRANIWFDRFTKGEVVIPDVDPITGEVNEVADDRSLDDLPDVAVDTAAPSETPVVDDPTAPDTTPVVNVTPDGGATVTVAKVTKARVTYVIPAGEFTANDFADANSLRRRKGIWGRIQSEIEAGRVVFTGQKKVGKGRPTSFYTAAPAAPAPVTAPAAS